MRGIEVREFGGPEVLEIRELADPEAGPGDALVATQASDVLFVDTMISSGRGRDYFPIRPPYIPGNGVGGRVEAVGEGVDADWLGKLVVARTGGKGGYADLATADVESCAAIPEGVDLLDATAVLHDGTTALRILEVTRPQAGEWVLILGAAGGMGIVLVQLLVGRGVHVVGAARGRIKQEVVSAAGAEVVDYSHPTWTQDVLTLTGGRKPAVVLDGVGGRLGTDAYDIISDGGRFSAHGTPSGSFADIDRDSARRRGITLTTIADLQSREEDRSRLLGAVLDELHLGSVAPLVGQTFALEDAEKAHLAIEQRETVAKTLLVV